MIQGDLSVDEVAPDVDEPSIRVVAGDPTAEELAALVVVLSSLGTTAPAPDPTKRDGWGAYWRGVRAPLAPGPGAWRAAGR